VELPVPELVPVGLGETEAVALCVALWEGDAPVDSDAVPVADGDGVLLPVGLFEGVCT
jgi:hypothetical protein